VIHPTINIIVICFSCLIIHRIFIIGILFWWHYIRMNGYPSCVMLFASVHKDKDVTEREGVRGSPYARICLEGATRTFDSRSIYQPAQEQVAENVNLFLCSSSWSWRSSTHGLKCKSRNYSNMHLCGFSLFVFIFSHNKWFFQFSSLVPCRSTGQEFVLKLEGRSISLSSFSTAWSH
jgi:hypothetical protein